MVATNMTAEKGGDGPGGTFVPTAQLVAEVDDDQLPWLQPLAIVRGVKVSRQVWNRVKTALGSLVPRAVWLARMGVATTSEGRLSIRIRTSKPR